MRFAYSILTVALLAAGLENTLGAVVTKRGLRSIEDILPNNGEIDKFNSHAPVTSMHAKFDVAIVETDQEEASATDFKTEEDIFYGNRF